MRGILGLVAAIFIIVVLVLLIMRFSDEKRRGAGPEGPQLFVAPGRKPWLDSSRIHCLRVG